MAALSIKNNKGFTLIEILMTLVISSIIMGSVFLTYSNQQKSYISSDKIAEAQQNLRAALLIMTSEIREAGCDPTGYANSGIVTASSTQINFTRDIAGHALNDDHLSDGDVDDPNENITFGFSAANDADNDGIADSGAADLGRDTGGGFQAVAENIQAIEFSYILSTGAVVTNPSTSQRSQIRSVQVSLLARTALPDKKFSNSQVYTTLSGTLWGPYNDAYKRRFASVTIQCRNLGFN